jgi:hypothetical protein
VRRSFDSHIVIFRKYSRDYFLHSILNENCYPYKKTLFDQNSCTDSFIQRNYTWFRLVPVVLSRTICNPYIFVGLIYTVFLEEIFHTLKPLDIGSLFIMWYQTLLCPNSCNLSVI